MRIKRTIKQPDSEANTISNIIPIYYIEQGDQVRAGFEKGTLKKVMFELETGVVITYEKVED